MGATTNAAVTFCVPLAVVVREGVPVAVCDAVVLGVPVEVTVFEGVDVPVAVFVPVLV